jgi:hypothetical protein
MIYINNEDVRVVGRRLGEYNKKAPTVIMRALNRAAESAKTDIAKQATENYWVKSAEVKKTMTITKASKGKLLAVVTSKATRRELTAFKVSPKKPMPKKPPKVVKVAVKKEGGLKELLGTFVQAGTSSGKPHVLQRATPKRYPIHIKYGPSVPEMIGANLSKRQFKRFVEDKVKETYERRLDHEIARIIEGGR